MLVVQDISIIHFPLGLASCKENSPVVVHSSEGEVCTGRGSVPRHMRGGPGTWATDSTIASATAIQDGMQGQYEIAIQYVQRRPPIGTHGHYSSGINFMWLLRDLTLCART